jgi:hypothetical protein
MGFTTRHLSQFASVHGALIATRHVCVTVLQLLD